MSTTEQFVRRKFQEFYMSPRVRLALPPRIEEREYGFLMFKEKFMVRHRAFKDEKSLLLAIRDLVPAHVYFSTAYYQDPTAAMDAKGWHGADLVFDIDADHLDTPCKASHDNWKCKACSTKGVGSTPKVCPKCKNDRFEDQTWLCERCLQQAKEETQHLRDVFFSDFASEEAEVRIYFSGHRGYHMHVRSESFRGLGEQERREIVDYYQGLGIDPELHGLGRNTLAREGIIEGPEIGDPGWRGRIVRGIYDVLTREGTQLGLSQAQMSALKAWDKDNLFGRPFWSSIRGVRIETWKEIISQAIREESVRIDTVVTTDVHRLIRLPGTLNGGTGLLAVEAPLEELDEFDPFLESVAFKGRVKIHVQDSPEFRVGEERFGPFRDEKVELPAAAAILLLCKKRADPVE